VKTGRTKWIIAVDGKVLRGSWTDENDQVTLFSAMLRDKRVTIAQVMMPDGISEITQVKALARRADIQQENPRQPPSTPLIAKGYGGSTRWKPGWDYLITVKTNKSLDVSQPTVICAISAMTLLVPEALRESAPTR
jgi:hypothetical protein